MAPPKKSALPKPLPDGFILTDTEKKTWRLGKIIGQGGFGLIYLASRDVHRPVGADTDFVIKVEYHENGPLFSELKFYQRAAKPESMKKWMSSRKLDFLGIPTYWGSGLAKNNDLSYRFMVMDRLGSDLQKVCDRNEGRLKKATVLQLGQRMLDVLEYIHQNEYVHGDIKAANLMQGYRDPDNVYLADYGLSYRYCPDGVHKEYKEDPKKGHNGTIEYTSIDAHNGVASSRRSDLQILGFCLLHWMCGSLPWDSFLKNPAQVQEAKTRLMNNLPDSVRQLSVNRVSTDEVAAFLLYVKNLAYQEKPDYQHLKDLLACDVRAKLDFSKPQQLAGESSTRGADTRIREKQKAGQARGASKAKPVATLTDEEQKGAKSRPVPAQYRPVVPRCQPQRAARKKTPRYDEESNEDESEDEDDDEEEDEEEEEKTRPTPIDARYLRGPPIGPRPPSKQKTKSIWTGRKGDNLTVTSARQEEEIQPQRRKYRFLDSDCKNQTHMRDWGRWEKRLLYYRADYNHHQRWDSDLYYEHGDRFGELERSAVKSLGQESGTSQWTGLLHQFGFVCVFLFLGVCVLGFLKF